MNGQAKKLIILMGDIFILYLSLFLTVYIRYSFETRYKNGFNFQILLEHFRAFSPLVLVWLVVFYIHNLYEITSAKNTLEFYTGLARSLAINFLTAVLFFYFANLGLAPKTNLFIYFAIFSALFILWRAQINSSLKKRFLVKTLIISGDDSGNVLASRLNHNPQIGYRVDHVIGSTLKISDFIKTHGVRAIIIDDNFLQKESLVNSLYDLVGNFEVTTLDKFNERVWRKVDLKNINQLWFLNNFASGRKIFYESVKRFLDFLMAVISLPLALGLGCLIALAIKLEDGGRIFYQQIRLGYHGRAFKFIKFRTMIFNAEAHGAQWTVTNDKRITRVGRFLRKTRLDEIPQLINILKGEMSFVGPRAERPEFHDLLVKEIPFYDRRYLVKPGLTGWAQINYTYGSSVEDTKEKLTYDFYYLKNRSLVFDIGIILKTVNIVLSGLGR